MQRRIKLMITNYTTICLYKENRKHRAPFCVQLEHNAKICGAQHPKAQMTKGIPKPAVSHETNDIFQRLLDDSHIKLQLR